MTAKGHNLIFVRIPDLCSAPIRPASPRSSALSLSFSSLSQRLSSITRPMLLIASSRPFCRTRTTVSPCLLCFARRPANPFPSYTTYVINDAETTYANAYFEINYINVYSNSTTSAANSSSGSSSGTSATKTNTIGASGTGSASASTSKSAARSFKSWEGAGTGMGWVYTAGMAVLGGLAMVL